METFGDFIDKQNINNKLIETATLMVVKDVEPVQFLQDWYQENHPELFVVLSEGLWDNIKQAGSQAWQGIKQGAGQFAANQFGPQSKFDTAMKSLTDLVSYMQNDPQLANMSGKLISQIGGINQQLQQLKNQIPQMQTQTTSNWTQPGQPGQPQPGQSNAWQAGQNKMAQQKRMGFPAMGG